MSSELLKNNDNQNSDEEKRIIIEERDSGNIFNNDKDIVRKFRRGKFLGKGGFAKVYEMIDLDTGKVFAAKIVPKSTLQKTRQRAKLQSEIKIHRSLNHENVVKFEHVFEDTETVYIQLELCPFQTLNELLKRRKRQTDVEIKVYVKQICNGILYLHQNKIIHRDLKLGNFFLGENMVLKIGDFGLAAKLSFETEKRHTVCGTPNYISPEILENRRGHSFEVDLWSLGVVIYTLYVGKPPFETTDVKTTYKRIKMASYEFPEQMSMDPEIKELIKKILILEPKKRLGISKIMKSPFMNPTYALPNQLPISTLACPLSNNMLKKLVIEKPNDVGSTQIASSDKVPKSGMLHSASTINLNTFPKALQESLGSKQKLHLLPRNLTTNTLQNPLSSTNGVKEVYITKWIDITTKYGLGYQMNNGHIGVFFNDKTITILNTKKEYFEYIERRENIDCINCWKYDQYPENLQKKVTLLHYFRTYLENDKTSKLQKPHPNPSPYFNKEALQTNKNNCRLVYVKKWIKTKHAIQFKLSTNVVHVDFIDKSQIILSADNKKVTYLNKYGEAANIPLKIVMNEKENDLEFSDLKKRLKYTKEMLLLMINKTK